MNRKKGVSVAMLQYFLQHPVFIRIDDSIFLDAYQMTGILASPKQNSVFKWTCNLSNASNLFPKP